MHQRRAFGRVDSVGESVAAINMALSLQRFCNYRSHSRGGSSGWEPCSYFPLQQRYFVPC